MARAASIKIVTVPEAMTALRAGDVATHDGLLARAARGLWAAMRSCSPVPRSAALIGWHEDALTRADNIRMNSAICPAQHRETFAVVVMQIRDIPKRVAGFHNVIPRWGRNTITRQLASLFRFPSRTGGNGRSGAPG